MVMATHWAIGTGDRAAPESWLVETSVARKECSEQVNGEKFTDTFAVAADYACNFIRLANTEGITSVIAKS
jgi:hypothetical protein